MKEYKGKNGSTTYYIGNVKKTQNGGSLFSICFEDIPKQAWKLHDKNGKHYLSGFINNAKDQKYGNTHDIVLQIKDESGAGQSSPAPKPKYDDARPMAAVKPETETKDTPF